MLVYMIQLYCDSYKGSIVRHICMKVVCSSWRWKGEGRPYAHGRKRTSFTLDFSVAIAGETY